MAEVSNWKYIVLSRPRYSRFMYEFTKAGVGAVRMCAYNDKDWAEDEAKDAAINNPDREYAVAVILSVIENRDNYVPVSRTITTEVI